MKRGRTYNNQEAIGVVHPYAGLKPGIGTFSLISDMYSQESKPR